MGCGISRTDGNGTSFPARLRPIIPEMSILRRNRASKYSTISIKKLLSRSSNASDGMKTEPSSLEDSVNGGRDFPEPYEKEVGKPRDVVPIKENGIAMDIGNEISMTKKDEWSKIITKDMEEDTSEDVFTDAECGEDDEDNNDDRTIGHGSNEAFFESLSFRIYYKDTRGKDEHDDDYIDDSFEDTVPFDDDVSQKESSSGSEVKKPIRSRAKRRTFSKFVPKGRHVKRLLTVKSCYFPLHSCHDRSHLVKEKTIY